MTSPSSISVFLPPDRKFFSAFYYRNPQCVAQSLRSLRYVTMEIDFPPRDERHPVRLKFEIFFNTLNHVFIGFVTINMTWMCFKDKWTVNTLHAWLCTIGYNLLLAESILCFYAANVWTDMYSLRAKTGVHWLLHMIGSGMGLAGAILKIVYEGGKFSSTVHAVLGFIASFLLLFNLVTSVGAVFHHCRGKKLHPFTHTALQNFLYFSFIAGMISQCLGYYYMESVDVVLLQLLIACTAITLVLTVLEYCVSYIKQCHTPVEDLEL